MIQKVGLLLLCLFLTMQLACGKKAPPFRSKGQCLLQLMTINGAFKDGSVELSGKVQALDGKKFNAKNIHGCRIYHALYSFRNPPCEGCPIDYYHYTEVKGEVVNKNIFLCKFKNINTQGIHFFRLHLIDNLGNMSKPSPLLKLLKNEN